MNNRIMKKLMAVALASAAMVVAWGAMAATEIVDGIEWTYTVGDGEASVGFDWDVPAVPTSTSGAITIPSKLGGCPVTSIGAHGFQLCTNLTSVTMFCTRTNGCR